MIVPLWALLGGLVGTTLIIVRGGIFAPLRKRLRPLACAQCVGWWVALLGGLALIRPIASALDLVEDALCVAGLVSMLSFAADSDMAWLDAKAFDAQGKSDAHD